MRVYSVIEDVGRGRGRGRGVEDGMGGDHRFGVDQWGWGCG